MPDKKDELNKEFKDLNQKDAEYHRYDTGRIVGKQGLRNMIAYYRGLEKGDKKLSEIMDSLDKLADMEATSDSGFWKEADAFNSSIKKMDDYISTLDKNEADLEKTSKGVFYQNGHWLTEEEIENSGSEELQDMNRMLNQRQNEIDNKRLLVSDLKVYLEQQTMGRLMPELPEEKQIAKPLNEEDRAQFKRIFEEAELKSDVNPKLQFPSQRERGKAPVVLPATRHIDGRNRKVDIHQYSSSVGQKVVNSILNAGVNITGGNTKDTSPIPLFPHEPCMDDITQGCLGDCFYLASIAKVAQLYPEKIKEMMCENGDNSVTVRLYSKNKNGEYSPVYVTVDKVIEQSGAFDINAQNSVWVNCLERALAISGLFSNFTNNRTHIHEPVPENIDAIYDELKKKQDAGQLTGEKLAEAVKTFPWVFTSNTEPPTLQKWPFVDVISGGHGGPATEILLGPGYEALAMSINNQRKNGLSEEKIQNNAYDKIKFAVDRNLPVGAGSDPSAQDVVGSHQYTVLNAYEHEGKRYIRMRNPHGTDADWMFNSKDITVVDSKQAIFDMELTAFCQNFDSIEANGENNNEITIDIPKKTDIENLELNDPSFIRDSVSLMHFLSQAPIVNLEKSTGDFTSTRSNPDGIFYSSTIWKNVVWDLMKREEGFDIKKYPATIGEDIAQFHSKLHEVLGSAFPKDNLNMNTSEIMEKVKSALVGAKDELVQGPSKDVLEKFYVQVVERTDNLLEMSKKGKFPGEEEMENFFDKLEEKRRIAGDNSELFFKTRDSNIYHSIDRIYKNESGMRMVCYNGQEMSGREFMQTTENLVLKDKRVEVGKGLAIPGEAYKAPEKTENIKLRADLGYEGFMQYKKVLDDMDRTLATEKGWFGKSSRESMALRQTLKDVRASIAGKSNIGFQELQEQLERLTLPLDVYEAHCAANPRKLQRRQNRLKACGILRSLQQSVEERKQNPIEEYQKEYTARIVQAAGKSQQKEYTSEQAKAIASRMLEDPQFRGFLVNQNVFHMNNASQRDINNDLKKMATKADKHVTKSEQKAVEKITKSGPSV